MPKYKLVQKKKNISLVPPKITRVDKQGQ